MKNRGNYVYLVEHVYYDEYTLNSIWTDRKLAEKRLSDIKKRIREKINLCDNKYLKKVYKEELRCWFINKKELNK